MTKEEVLAVEAGRELDYIVASQVTHWVGDITLCPHYSTDVSAAWWVVDKMFELGYAMSLLHLSSESYPEYWYCDFRLKDSNRPPEYQWVDHQMTAPVAVCKAALLAKLGAEGG